MAGFISTVNVSITRLTTLMTMRYDIFRNALCSSLIKNKVLSNKFVFKFFLLYLTHIVNDPPFELINIFKTFVFVIRTCFFTSYSPSTVHHQVFILFMHFQIFLNNRQRVSKGIHIWGYGILKMSDFTFVVIPHIDQHRIWIFYQ